MSGNGAPKRVLYVEANTDGTIGGSHTCLLELIRGLDRSRFEPLVLFYEDNALVDAFQEAASEVVIFHKPRVFRLPSLKRAAREGSLMGQLSWPLLLGKKGYNLASQLLVPTAGLARIMKERRVDLVHLNNAVVHPPEAAMAARLLGLPCLVHQRAVCEGLGPRTKRLAEGLKAVACVSRHVMESLVENGVEAAKCHLVYDGCDTEALAARVTRPAAEVRREFGLSNGQPMLLLVGNVKEWKGQRTAVEAAVLLRERYPDLKLLLVGGVSDEAYAGSLRERIAEAGLERNIIWCGYRHDVPELMSAADIVLHTSIEPEPFGITILEAAASSKPIVATEIGGPLETVQDGVTGLLVPPAEPQLLAEAIRTLLAQPALAAGFGAAARERLERLFSLKAHIGQVEQLYSACL